LNAVGIEFVQGAVASRDARDAVDGGAHVFVAGGRRRGGRVGVDGLGGEDRDDDGDGDDDDDDATVHPAFVDVDAALRAMTDRAYVIEGADATAAASTRVVKAWSDNFADAVSRYRVEAKEATRAAEAQRRRADAAERELSRLEVASCAAAKKCRATEDELARLRATRAQTETRASEASRAAAAAVAAAEARDAETAAKIAKATADARDAADAARRDASAAEASRAALELEMATVREALAAARIRADAAEARATRSDAAVADAERLSAAAFEAATREAKDAKDARDSGAFYTLVPIRPRSRGERRSSRTLPGVSLRPPLAFNPRPRRLSTPSDAFELHPDFALYGTTLSSRRGDRRDRARGRRGRARRSPRGRRAAATRGGGGARGRGGGERGAAPRRSGDDARGTDV